MIPLPAGNAREHKAWLFLNVCFLTFLSVFKAGVNEGQGGRKEVGRESNDDGKDPPCTGKTRERDEYPVHAQMIPIFDPRLMMHLPGSVLYFFDVGGSRGFLMDRADQVVTIFWTKIKSLEGKILNSERKKTLAKDLGCPPIKMVWIKYHGELVGIGMIPNSRITGIHLAFRDKPFERRRKTEQQVTTLFGAMSCHFITPS